MKHVTACVECVAGLVVLSFKGTDTTPVTTKLGSKYKTLELTYERDIFWGRHDLCHHELKYSHGQKDGHAQGDLFPRGCREIKTQGSQKRYEDAWDEEVDNIEGGSPLQKEGECHVGVWLRAAAIGDHVLHRRHAMHLPLHVFDEIREVSAVQGIEDVHLVAIVGPGAKGQVALLVIKGEVGDIHHTGAFGDGRRIPGDQPIIAQDHIGVHRLGRFIVSPGGGGRKTRAACWRNSPASPTDSLPACVHRFDIFGDGPPLSLSLCLKNLESTLVFSSPLSPVTSEGQVVLDSSFKAYLFYVPSSLVPMPLSRTKHNGLCHRTKRKPVEAELQRGGSAYLTSLTLGTRILKQLLVAVERFAHVYCRTFGKQKKFIHP